MANFKVCAHTLIFYEGINVFYKIKIPSVLFGKANVNTFSRYFMNYYPELNCCFGVIKRYL